MDLLAAGVDTSTIALWLGHAATKAPDVYLHADMKLKEKALARTAPRPQDAKRYRPADNLARLPGEPVVREWRLANRDPLADHPPAQQDALVRFATPTRNWRDLSIATSARIDAIYGSADGLVTWPNRNARVPASAGDCRS